MSELHSELQQAIVPWKDQSASCTFAIIGLCWYKSTRYHQCVNYCHITKYEYGVQVNKYKIDDGDHVDLWSMDAFDQGV